MSDQLDIFAQDLVSLDKEEAAVWKIIRDHKGRDNAIKADAIAWCTKLSEVKVREIVSHLVRRHSKLIGSSTVYPAGFYVIEDPIELRAQVKSLRHRGIMCLVRAAALNKTSVEDIFGQAKLEMENEG